MAPMYVASMRSIAQRLVYINFYPTIHNKSSRCTCISQEQLPPWTRKYIEQSLIDSYHWQLHLHVARFSFCKLSIINWVWSMEQFLGTKFYFSSFVLSPIKVPRVTTKWDLSHVNFFFSLLKRQITKVTIPLSPSLLAGNFE